MQPLRRVFASFLLMSLLPLALAGQRLVPGDTGKPVLHAFFLKYQRASDALPLVHPLLSPHGTVELQPGDNTLVIRDTATALARILPVLRKFDHPVRSLQMEIFLVRASRAQISPVVPRSDLPEELTQNLRQLLPYDTYKMQSQARLATREGESVTYDLGDDFQIDFRLGTVLADGRVKLSDFHIARMTPAGRQEMIHTNLNLWLDQTMSLGLAKSEKSREALMVVLTLKEDARRGGRVP